MDEQFFFLYHLKVGRKEFLGYPINERKYMINKFIEQRERENEHIEKARKK